MDIYYDLAPSTFQLVTDDPQAGNARVCLAVYREVLTQPSSTFTLVGSIGETGNQTTPVSEPATLFLLGIGLVGLGTLRPRARKR